MGLAAPPSISSTGDVQVLEVIEGLSVRMECPVAGPLPSFLPPSLPGRDGRRWGVV